jgi:ParB-like chromosome segregation protein Spo0J
MKGESFQALMESIRQKGVLEPVLVARRDERFLPISGERRFPDELCPGSGEGQK